MYRGKFVFSISKGNIRQSLSTNGMIWIKSCLDNHLLLFGFYACKIGKCNVLLQGLVSVKQTEAMRLLGSSFS